MNTAPQLPDRISPDGSELWEWAGKCAQFIHHEVRIQELRSELRRIGHTCGDCDKWMKSRECPRERPGEGRRSGYSVGPSMNDPTCNQYTEAHSTTKRRDELQAELITLTT